MSVVKKITFGNGQLNQFMFVPNQANNSSQPAVQQPVAKESSDDTIKSLSYVSSAVALAALGVSTAFAIRSGKTPKNSEKNSDEIVRAVETALKPIKDDVNALKIKSDVEGKLNERFQGYTDWVKSIEEKVGSLGESHGNWLQSVEKLINEKSEFSIGWLKAIEERVNGIAVRVSEMSATERNIVKIDGLNLLQNITSDGKRVNLGNDIIQELQTVAKGIIHTKSEVPKLDKNATVWSLTAESIPEKEGGLGEVPVQIAKNMTKELGINNYLLRPVNEIPGVSSIVEKDGKFHYRYKDLRMDVDKVAEFEIYAFRNGRTEKEMVEVFVGDDPKFGFKRLMFKNKDYFQAEGLYTDSQRSSEKERYAFFPKAVYEFAKIKMDPASQTSYKIFNEDLFNKISAPDTLLLNDWHTAAMAGLTKLLAPVEAAQKELSASVAERMKKMNVVEIIHNADYQGQDWAHAGDIMNTLYGKYAYDIYTNAKTGLTPDGLQNVHIIDGSINLANIAASLANKLKPVSPTYAKELGDEFARGHSLQHIFRTRLDAQTMVGQSNGWDKSVNEVSSKNLSGFNNNLNKDKFAIFEKGLDSLTLPKVVKDSIEKIFTDKNNSKLELKVDNFETILKSLRELGIDEINKFIDKMDADGITQLRGFKAVTDADDIDTIMEVRRHNKAQFLQYLKAMAEYSKSDSKLFNLATEGVTDLSKVNFDDLDNQIVINCGTRFVGQKGVDILAGAMEQILEEWPTRYPGKPKPIFPVGGKDGEGGTWEALMRSFKTNMGEKADTVPYMVGYTPNNIFHGGSDITLYPSHFEPDGSKWESLNKGTPVVATKVGGHVDSIVDGVNGYLTNRTVPEVKSLKETDGFDYLPTMIYDFKQAIYRACDDFFNKDKWKQMVRHAIDGDQSWLIKDNDGKIVGGSLLGHLEDLGYNLDDFSQIAKAEARKAFVESKHISDASEKIEQNLKPKPKSSVKKTSRKSNRKNPEKA